jgi:hypothetical protein
MSRKLVELKAKYGVSERAAVLIGRMDPTANQKYVEWLFKVRYIAIGNGKYRTNGDFPATLENTVKESLVWFERNLNGKVPVDFRDINKFKTINEFLIKVQELATPSRSEIKDSVRVVLDDDRFKVIVPLIYEASKLHGVNTKWCTTNKTYYDDYMRRGILYYVLDKTLNRKFGIHVPDSAGLNYNFNQISLFNNEDRTLNMQTMNLIYGDGFNIVLESLKKDFNQQIMVKLKKKALTNAINKITEVKRELVNTNLNNDEIEKILDSFFNIIRTKEDSLNT